MNEKRIDDEELGVVQVTDIDDDIWVWFHRTFAKSRAGR